MAGEIGEHGAPLIDAEVGIGFADHRLPPRLMQAGVEREFAAMRGSCLNGTTVQPVITLAKFVTSSWA